MMVFCAPKNVPIDLLQRAVYLSAGAAVAGRRPNLD